MGDIRKKIDDYYKKQGKFIDGVMRGRKLDKVEYFEISDEKKHAVKVLDADGNVIYLATYVYMGIYDKSIKLWKWAWTLPSFDPSLILNMEKIQSFADELSKDYDIKHSADYDKYHYLSKKGYYFIGKNELMNVVSMGLYREKGLWYIPIQDKIGDHEVIRIIIIKELI